jgi:hypothetical protein
MDLVLPLIIAMTFELAMGLSMFLAGYFNTGGNGSGVPVQIDTLRVSPGYRAGEAHCYNCTERKPAKRTSLYVELHGHATALPLRNSLRYSPAKPHSAAIRVRLLLPNADTASQ